MIRQVNWRDLESVRQYAKDLRCKTPTVIFNNGNSYLFAPARLRKYIERRGWVIVETVKGVQDVIERQGSED